MWILTSKGNFLKRLIKRVHGKEKDAVKTLFNLWSTKVNNANK